MPLLQRSRSSSFHLVDITKSSAVIEAAVALDTPHRQHNDTASTSNYGVDLESLADVTRSLEHTDSYDDDELLDGMERSTSFDGNGNDSNVVVEDPKQFLVAGGEPKIKRKKGRKKKLTASSPPPTAATTTTTLSSTLEVEPANNTTAAITGSTTTISDVEGTPSLSAYLVLIGAVLGLSSIGPFLSLQEGVDPTIKIVWRNSTTTIALLPLALQSLQTEGLPRLTRAELAILFLTGCSYAGWTVFFAWSLNYTTIGNAVLFGNCQSMLFLMGRALMGKPILMTEGAGAIIAFSGAVLCSHDSAAKDPKAPGEGSSFLGDMYAVISASCGVVYLSTAKLVRPKVNLYLFTFCIMSLAALNAIILAHVGTGIDVSWDRDDCHGLFGWAQFRSNRLPLEICMVVMCQFCGAMGYIRSMSHFSNLAISVATLSEPVVAELTAVLLGVGDLPGWKGWIGNALVFFGTLTVIYRPPAPQKKL